MKTKRIFKPAVLATILGMSTLMSAGNLFADDAPTSINEDAISLLQAVKIARQHTGAEPLQAEREVEMGQTFYEITLTTKDGQEIETDIDAQTGAVILSRMEKEDRDDARENALLFSGIQSGKFLSLEKALTQTEKAMNGRAWTIDIDHDHNEVEYEVELLGEDNRRLETRFTANSAT
ncbi:PepSY domain-containing protein [uncultured Endozoicomonas sp.]|uniref:PepSY domain-containing protein n=1 Tax=uncultured Endozoicomonas sp. TaxID=432652 RepID=UPI0026209DBF|nr:PepSY domain-containing protein [uncultured Endozoicomonas sp.]